MHHICTPKRMLTGLLTVALTAIFAQSALAYSVGQNDSTFVAQKTFAGQTTKTPIVIPYLSHGVGVDRSLFSGKSTDSSAKAPLVIPYLSHGVGVDSRLYDGKSTESSAKAPLVIPYLSHGVGIGKSQFGGQGAAVSHTADAEQSFNGGTTAQPSDVFTRAVERHEAFVKAMNATAATTAQPSDVFTRAVARHEALGKAMDATAVRPDNRAGTLGIGTSVSSQSQSTAVRPDDRAGLRGIGDFRVSQSPTANSGTDWSSILQFGGVVLGVLLVIAAAVALTRPRGRVIAH